MNNLTRQPKHDPTFLYRYRDGIYAPELLGAAVASLDFFTWLAKSPADAQTICKSLALEERPVDVMLTLFCAMGLIERKKDTFRLTPIAKEFLTRESPWFIGPYYAPFKDRPVCRDLLEVLRTGKPTNWASRKDNKAWAEAMEDDAFSEQFTQMMDARGLYLGPKLARKINFKPFRHVLDIAGASGIYACCLVAAHPHLRATVFERAPVDRVARKCIAQRGCAERVAVAQGDMFAAPFPDGCDVHLFSNVLHDWDVPAVKSLLQKSYAALPAGGMVLIHDAHLNRQKTGPLPVAAHSVFLMAITEGRYYSISEIERFLSEAGFRGMSYRKNALDHSIIAARKPRR
ncbi:MAG: methyltransferase [Acidobacteriia bacterium]|nr:methyltransferase [Terriglobia bacterium]